MKIIKLFLLYSLITININLIGQAQGSTAPADESPAPLAAPTFTTTPSSVPTPPVATPPAPAPVAPTQPTPATPEAATTASNSTPAVPTPPKIVEQFLTSIYIQNNAKEDAILTHIEVLLDNKETPIIKKDLNIKIPALKNLYSRGSITAFDLTSPSKDINKFNGISSMIINGDKIELNKEKMAYNLKNPIKITKKDGHWILDDK